MQLKKNIVIPVITCIALLCITLCLSILIEKRQDKALYNNASAIDELEIFVDFPSATKRIKGWKNPEGVLTFFLPSGAENYSVTFGNLCPNSLLTVDEKQIKADTELLKELQLEEKYVTEFISPNGNAEKEQIQLIKSAAIATMFLETESGNEHAIHADKFHKEKADILLLNSMGETEYINDIEYVKARGNSTFYHADKKSYQIKLDRATEILGMPAAKKWILLANEIDYTLMKNELVFRFTEKYSSIPTIQGRYIDLFVNHKYVGNYYLCEKVEVQENRLDITDLQEATEHVNYQRDYNLAEIYISDDGNVKATKGLQNPKDITGGYLVEHITVSEFEISNNAFRTQNGHCYQICSPEIATKEQAEYICNFFNEMESAILANNGINEHTGKHYSDYLDVDSWVMKYLMEEAFSDGDAGAASAFFYKDSDTIDSHLFAGPMWDYDRALGSYGYLGNFNLDDPKGVRNLGIYASELMAHEDVVEKVREALHAYLIPYVDNLMQADIYTIRQEIAQSVKMNHMRWPKIYGYYSDYAAATDYLGIFLKNRVTYLNDVWGGHAEYCTVDFLDYDGSVAHTYRVKRGEYLPDTPQLFHYAAVFAGWKSVENGLPFDIRLPILQDVTYESEWIEMEVLLENGLDLLKSDTEKYEDIPDWTQIPSEQLEGLIKYLREVLGSQEDAK